MRRSECYQRLGLRNGATEAQVKEAFRRRAKYVHPDVNAGPEAHEAFVRLLEAYRTLRDEPAELPFEVPSEPVPQAPQAPASVGIARRHWGVSFCALFGLGVMLSASAVKPPEPPGLASPSEPLAIVRSGEPSTDMGRSAAEPGAVVPGSATQGLAEQKSATPRASEASPPEPTATPAGEKEIVAPVAGPTIRRAASQAASRRIGAPRRSGPKVAARNENRRWMATLPRPPRAQPRRPRVQQWEEVEADGRNDYVPAPPQPAVPQLPGLGLLRTLLGPQ